MPVVLDESRFPVVRAHFVGRIADDELATYEENVLALLRRCEANGQRFALITTGGNRLSPLSSKQRRSQAEFVSRHRTLAHRVVAGNAIVVTKETARRLDLTTLSELSESAGKLRPGAIPGFDTREDGLPLLRSAYGMRFSKVQTLENGIKYQALLDGKIDAVYGFETDGQIAAHDLVVLRDDRAVWPAYQVAPVVSRAFTKRVGPEFAATIDHVSSLLDARTMARLNAKVDQGGREPADVARRFLHTQGLLR